MDYCQLLQFIRRLTDAELYLLEATRDVKKGQNRVVSDQKFRNVGPRQAFRRWGVTLEDVLADLQKKAHLTRHKGNRTFALATKTKVSRHALTEARRAFKVHDFEGGGELSPQFWTRFRKYVEEKCAGQVRLRAVVPAP